MKVPTLPFDIGDRWKATHSLGCQGLTRRTRTITGTEYGAKPFAQDPIIDPGPGSGVRSAASFVAFSRTAQFTLCKPT